MLPSASFLTLLDFCLGSFSSRFLNSAGTFTFQVFYFQEKAYPPPQGRFHGHAEWSGDVSKWDASITLKKVPPTFNGTYICQVRNRPDVQGSNGEIVLKVVNKGSGRELFLSLSFFFSFSVVVVSLQLSCIFNSAVF